MIITMTAFFKMNNLKFVEHRLLDKSLATVSGLGIGDRGVTTGALDQIF